eukprot:jgi/Mesvir1/9830/Mv14233-RA.1
MGWRLSPATALVPRVYDSGNKYPNKMLAKMTSSHESSGVEVSHADFEYQNAASKLLKALVSTGLRGSSLADTIRFLRKLLIDNPLLSSQVAWPASRGGITGTIPSSAHLINCMHGFSSMQKAKLLSRLFKEELASFCTYQERVNENPEQKTALSRGVPVVPASISLQSDLLLRNVLLSLTVECSAYQGPVYSMDFLHSLIECSQLTLHGVAAALLWLFGARSSDFHPPAPFMYAPVPHGNKDSLPFCIWRLDLNAAQWAATNNTFDEYLGNGKAGELDASIDIESVFDRSLQKLAKAFREFLSNHNKFNSANVFQIITTRWHDLYRDRFLIFWRPDAATLKGVLQSDDSTRRARLLHRAMPMLPASEFVAFFGQVKQVPIMPGQHGVKMLAEAVGELVLADAGIEAHCSDCGTPHYSPPLSSAGVESLQRKLHMVTDLLTTCLLGAERPATLPEE